MSKRIQILQPLNKVTQQVYVGRSLHTLGLIRWIVEQIGKADVEVTTFSTSVEFLSGFLLMRKQNLIGRASVILDLKASVKTARLNTLLHSCFDEVLLTENHTKIVLAGNDDYHVTVITSMNNTYGGRNECTYLSTDKALYDELLLQLDILKRHSYKYGNK